MKEMHDPAKFKQYLGDESKYHEYLEFFREEMEKKGWQGVLNEYLFGFDERSDDLLVQMYAGRFPSPTITFEYQILISQASSTLLFT